MPPNVPDKDFWSFTLYDNQTRSLLQTIPGKGWSMLFRLCGPLKPWFDKTWRPGDPGLVK